MDLPGDFCEGNLGKEMEGWILRFDGDVFPRSTTHAVAAAAAASSDRSTVFFCLSDVSSSTEGRRRLDPILDGCSSEASTVRSEESTASSVKGSGVKDEDSTPEELTIEDAGVPVAIVEGIVAETTGAAVEEVDAGVMVAVDEVVVDFSEVVGAAVEISDLADAAVLCRKQGGRKSAMDPPKMSSSTTSSKKKASLRFSSSRTRDSLEGALATSGVTGGGQL